MKERAGEQYINVCFEQEGRGPKPSIKGEVSLDCQTPHRKKIVFIFGYDSRNDDPWPTDKPLPADGEEWRCIVNWDSDRNDPGKGCLQVSLLENMSVIPRSPEEVRLAPLISLLGNMRNAQLVEAFVAFIKEHLGEVLGLMALQGALAVPRNPLDVLANKSLPELTRSPIWDELTEMNGRLIPLFLPAAMVLLETEIPEEQYGTAGSFTEEEGRYFTCSLCRTRERMGKSLFRALHTDGEEIEFQCIGCGIVVKMLDEEAANAAHARAEARRKTNLAKQMPALRAKFSNGDG